jgi:flavin-dependent dehydrogenase
MKKEIETDVAIIGSGTAGLVVAMFLAEERISFVCLEKEKSPFTATY